MSDDWQVALRMLKRGQHLNADHPLVVIEDEIACLREREAQLEEALREIAGNHNPCQAGHVATARRALAHKEEK